MFFQWFRQKRRSQILEQPFPREWLDVLEQNVYHYSRVTREEQAAMRDSLRIIIAEKNWEGCNGFTVTDEVKVTIAAEASLLLLGLEDQYFDMVQSILVYPAAYRAHGHSVTPGGVVLEGDSDRGGEAWYRGPVVLSWDYVLAGARHRTHGDNLVLHEFAHQLDMQNGRYADGIPPLESAQQYRHWQEVLTNEYERLVHDCEEGHPTLLSDYGATNTAEFFAVATETFFELPGQMARRHPRLYEILRGYYHQDPALRETGGHRDR